MKLRHRLLATVIAILVASYAAGWLWLALFDFTIPGYIAGMVGGLAAIPVWEWLRRIAEIK
jgi:hypothetical protein